MADKEYFTAAEGKNDGCFKEAVCIDAMRIYDSCCEQDCTS